MLAADWAASRSDRGDPLVWVSLDSDDNDPVLFWSYVLAGVRGAVAELSPPLSGLAIRHPIGREVRRRILVGLAELREPLTLVLDDFNEVDNVEILDAISDLLRHPSAIRLVVVTRFDPALHLHRLRVDGHLSEIRAADLALSSAEAGQLLQQAGVPPDQHEQLVHRTEGWVAGLRLAAMSADASDDAESGGPGEYEGTVAEYLFEEVLAGLPEERRRFLLRTSVADELCGELADLLSGGSGGQRELERLEQANAFAIALGPGKRWFRYHALMADLLRQRLWLDAPDLYADLHRRAARWFAANQDPLAAVRHAVRARDWQLVGELMVGGAAGRAVLGERQAYAALLEEIPASELSASAELRVCGALLRFLDQDYAGFALQVDEARVMLAGRTPEAARPVEVFLCAADMVLARVRGDMTALSAAADQMLEWLSDPAESSTHAAVQQFEAGALSNRGVALIWSARGDEAEPYLRSSLDVAVASGAELTGLNSLGYLGLLELERGRLQDAATVAQQGLDLAEQRGSTELAQAIAVYLVLAEVHLLRNELDRAQDYLARGLAAQRNDPEWTPYVALRCLQALLLLASGDVDRAVKLMRSVAAEIKDWTPPDRLRHRLVCVDAEVKLAQGRMDAARQGLQAYVEDDVAPVPEEVSVCGARIALAMGEFADAEERVARIQDAPDSRVAAVDAWLTTALAADHVRDDHRALGAMERALSTAEPDKIRRPFMSVDVARVEAILRHRLRLGTGGDFAEGILEQLEPSVRRRVPTPLGDPLTDREKVVLSHMALLQTNAEIAAALYVSVNTVKAHAKSVYRKLAVSNRREAVNSARDLGLI